MEFSRPSITVPVPHEAPQENELPTPELEGKVRGLHKVMKLFPSWISKY